MAQFEKVATEHFRKVTATDLGLGLLEEPEVPVTVTQAHAVE